MLSGSSLLMWHSQRHDDDGDDDDDDDDHDVMGLVAVIVNVSYHADQ